MPRRRPRVKRINIAPHVRRVRAHHKRGKKKLLKIFHKIRSHPGCYKAGYRHHRGKAPKSLPRKPRGLNKRGSGFWDHVKHAWNWITGHPVVKDMQKQVVNHVKETGKELAKEYGGQLKSYGKAMGERGKVWVKKQADAAIDGVKKTADKHISNLTGKVEHAAGKVDKFVSGYTGATDDQMPGRTVGKKGSGFFQRMGRAGTGRMYAQRFLRRAALGIARRNR